jgi:hypothetical protein
MRYRLSQAKDGAEVAVKRVQFTVILLILSVRRERNSHVFQDECHDLASEVTRIKTSEETRTKTVGGHWTQGGIPTCY